MARVYEVDHSFCSAHWAYKIRSIGDVHQGYKAVISLWINIKCTRPTTSTSRAKQEGYRVFQNYQKAVAHLTSW